MTEFNNILNQPIKSQVSFFGEENISLKNENGNMKVKRPIIGNITSPDLFKLKRSFSDEDANRKFNQINSDIYEGTAKEKSNHEFNFRRYLKIFSGIALLTILLSYFGKFRK